jgi:hypothetical protein
MLGPQEALRRVLLPITLREERDMSGTVREA